MRLEATLVFLLLIVVGSSSFAQAFWTTSPATTRRASFVKTTKHFMVAAMVDPDHNKGTPISSQKLVFSEENAELQWNRQAAFDRFQTIVESLANLDDDNEVSLIWTNDREVNHQDVIPINSLLFFADDISSGGDNNTPIVVIVPSSRRVDVEKLQEHLEEDNHDERIPNACTKCSLVPADQVEDVCGFPPMSVPPIGHIPHTLRIIVDETLYEEGNILLGGGGHPKIGCLIAAETLLRIEGTELANITTTTNTAAGAPPLSEDASAAIPPKPQQRQFASVTKPYFQVAPPTMAQVQNVLSNPDKPNPLTPLPLTIVGRINGLRRMARRLVFVDLAPPDYVGTGTKIDSFDLPWKSALDHQDMSVQLIAGKTFCKNRGDPEGPEALKRLKVGQLILVQGKTNVGNRESLGHWADKRSLDIVVFDYRVLEESRPKELAQPTPFYQMAQPPDKQLPPPPSEQPSSNILQLRDVLSESACVKIVDDRDGISEFHQRLEMLSSAGINGDKTPLLTGIDCEWKPNFMTLPGEPQPVLLLQVSLQKLKEVYLIDLQALLRPCQHPSEPTNELESSTSDTLSYLFGSPRFLKIGFQLMHDLQRLASSYPHIPAFRSIAGVMEVSTVAKKAMQIAKIRNAKQLTSSLSRLTRYFMEKLLNKDQQVSDWSCRPLGAAQEEYAALDAAVAPILLEKSMALVDAQWWSNTGESQSQKIGRYQDDMSFAKAVSSVLFHILESDNPVFMRKIRAKKVISNQWLVTQSWVAGTDPPSPPSVPTTEDDMYVDVGGTQRVPAFTLRVRDNENERFLEGLVGQRLGKSKENCLESLLLGHTDFPTEAKLEYNQRSGYVEFDDLVALFVNLPVRPGEPSPRGYPNVWLEDGKYMTWYLRKKEWMEGNSDLAQKLLQQNDSIGGSSEAPTVLFVKTKRGHFLCCGRCRVNPMRLDDEGGQAESKDWGLVELRLELIDWPSLQHIPDFSSMAFTTASVSDSDSVESCNGRSREEVSSRQHALARAVLEGDLETAKALAQEMLARQEANS